MNYTTVKVERGTAELLRVLRGVTGLPAWAIIKQGVVMYVESEFDTGDQKAVLRLLARAKEEDEA